MALSLTSLPPELIQLILRKCDTASFLQAAFSCRAFLANASSSRDLILHQLQNSPGTSEDVEHLSHKQLFQRLLQVSRRELYGAEFGSSTKLYTFGGRVIDVGASVVLTAGDINRALLVFKGDSTLYLMKIGGGRLSLLRRIESPAKKHGKVEILHTTMDAGDISVLHRLTPDEPNSGNAFVKHALESNSIFLARYTLNIETRLFTLSMEDPIEQSYDPLSFASYDDQFAICWQHKSEENTRRVKLYRSIRGQDENDDDNYEDEDPPIIETEYESYLLSETFQGDESGDSGLKGPSVKMAFNDMGQQLLHYYRSQPLFGSFQRIRNPEDFESLRSGHNECLVAFSNSLNLRFSIGIPFFGIHSAGDLNSDWRARCHWRYLSVGFATHRVEKWTVACILMSQSSPQARGCTHEMNLDRGRRFDEWTIVAQLGGFQDSITSQGPLIATSNLGTRVAIASWRTVTIWPLNPYSLITHGSEDYADFYPDSDSWRSEAGYVELRPIIIQLDAVCFKLHFAKGENEIIALTDKGILFLQLDPNGKAARVVDTSRIEDIPYFSVDTSTLI